MDSGRDGTPIGTFRAAVRLAGAIGLALFAGAAPSVGEPVARVWLTALDGSAALAPRPDIEFGERRLALMPSATVDPSAEFQTILGIGSSLEPTTAYNLSRLDEADRERVVEALVSPDAGIGMNLMRVCIGTPDFTGDPWYSYDDVPPGETDPKLERFTIGKDREYILPAIRAALAKNPDLLVFASPWSPPGWMKTTGTPIGGKLLPERYSVYAEYFVRFVRAYEAEGVPIHAVTIQNEPGVDRSLERDPKWFYPSCRWTGEEERDFIRDHLGPAFEREGLATEIWCYDHNYNELPLPGDPGIAYPRTILSDPAAARFVDAVAFHGYAGKPEGMAKFHAEFPDVPVCFTEGSVFGLSGARRLIELFRNGAASYNAWVTMIDSEGKPNNGPFQASKTMVVLDAGTLAAEYRFDYAMYGNFSKFVRRGAKRIGCETSADDPAAVAFRNPDGEIVLVAVNSGGAEKAFQIFFGDRRAETRLPARSLATFVWKP